MDQWIKDLWEKNKIAFFLILPILLLFIFKNVIIQFLIGSSKKVVNDAKAEDKELAVDIAKKDVQSDTLKEEAKQIEDKIKQLEDDEDWHKKR